VTTPDAPDRRRAERLKLSELLSGTFDGKPVSVIEVGLLGALVEHADRLDDGTEGALVFEWEEEPICVEARIAHSEVSLARTESRGETVYLSGVEFASSSESDAAVLKRMISVHVTRSLERMKANARGSTRPMDEAMSLLRTPAPFLETPQETTKIYLCFRLDASGQWHRAEVLKPKQPPDGFTLAADSSEDDITLLCRSYEEGNEDARKMIRVCAEIALAAGEDVPPASFV
jgi:hypothetical protein